MTADENPYCMKCGKHLGMPFHETNEHDEAAQTQPPEAAGAPSEKPGGIR